MKVIQCLAYDTLPPALKNDPDAVRRYNEAAQIFNGLFSGRKVVEGF
jgi:hypothetical protein